MSYYISGPMTGLPYYNFTAFIEAEQYLHDNAWPPVEVFNPARKDLDAGFNPATDVVTDEMYQDMLTADLLDVEQADTMIMLTGWEGSHGACTEVTHFAWLNDNWPWKVYNLVDDHHGKRILHLTEAQRRQVQAMLEEKVRGVEPTTAEVPAPADGWAVNPPNPEPYEVRTESETGGQKGVKRERYDLLPAEALAEVARIYGFGAAKYDDRNWEKGYEYSKSFAALQRHQWAWWGGEDKDPESGLSHLASAAFHVLALLEWELTGEFPNYDDRPKHG